MQWAYSRTYLLPVTFTSRTCSPTNLLYIHVNQKSCQNQSTLHLTVTISYYKPPCTSHSMAISTWTWLVSYPFGSASVSEQNHFHRLDALPVTQLTVSKYWRILTENQSTDPNQYKWPSFVIHHHTAEERSTAPFMVVLSAINCVHAVFATTPCTFIY